MTLELTTVTEGAERVGGHDVAAQIRCSRCGEAMEPGEAGKVCWEPDSRERYVDVIFLHPRCVDAHAAGKGGELRSTDLASFLAALIHNLEEAG